MKVMSTDAGIEIAVTMVDRIDMRNTRITSTANTRPSRPSVVRLEIDCSMKGAWSNTTVNFVLLPRSSDSCGRSWVTRCETSTVLPAGVFETAMVSDGWPSTREMPVVGSWPSCTEATSPIVSARPPAAPSSGSEARSWVDPRRVPDCTDSVVPSSVTDPAGRSEPFASSASRIAWFVRPAACTSAGSGVMTTRCPTVPSRLASRTPASLRMSASVERSSAAVRSCGLRSLVTAIWITGRSSMLPAITTGSIPSGSVVRIRLMDWSIFCSAVARSVPYVNDAEMTEESVREVAVEDSRPGTAWIARSMGVDTSVSTTAGDAPGYAVTTASCGNDTDGMSSCLSVVSAMPPNTPMTIVMSAISARLRRLKTERRCRGCSLWDAGRGCGGRSDR